MCRFVCALRPELLKRRPKPGDQSGNCLFGSEVLDPVVFFWRPAHRYRFFSFRAQVFPIMIFFESFPKLSFVLFSFLFLFLFFRVFHTFKDSDSESR